MEQQGMPAPVSPDSPRSERDSSVDPAVVAPLVMSLARLRGRARLLLVSAAAASLLATVIAGALAAGVLDFLLRTPAWMRLVVLLSGLAAIAVAVQRLLIPGWRFRPALTEVALRLERSKVGQEAGLTGLLASGLELAHHPPETQVGKGMAAHVVERARRAAEGVRASAILNPTQARHGLVVLAICLAALGGIGVMVGPGLMTTGAVRIFAPWAGAEWPKRTAVVDATTVEVHALGTALPLRAAVTRSDREPDQTRVAARYRLVTAEGHEASRRAMLAWQGHTIGLTPAAPGEPAIGQFYERLVEPSALAALSGVAPSTVMELEYWFETDDDRTKARRIKLVQPPTVLSARATVTPPQYASGLAAGEPGRGTFVAGARELGAGNDQRAVVGPILAGSRIELEIDLNKGVPVPGAAGGEGEEDRARWVAKVLPGLEMSEDLEMTFDQKRWRMVWPAHKSVRVGVEPVDEFGIAKLEESSFSFDVIEDRPPTATIVEPREDEAVLATAIVEVMGEGRDDVGVERATLEQQVARPARGSVGAAAEAAGEPVSVATRQWLRETAPVQATVSGQIDLSVLELKPRDEVWLTAVVQDTFFAFDGARHEPVRSAARRLRIISEEELVDQMRSELGALRRVAMRLDEEQAQVQSTVRTGEISSEDAQRQAGLTQRLQQQRAAVQRLIDRMERNRLADETLGGLLEDIDMLFRGAGQDSDRAAAQMQAAAREEDEIAQLTEEQQRGIAEAQDAVRDQLGRMAEMLDRGEDSWVMSRTLQRLLQQQRDLQAQTERVGERTMGRRAEDLSPQERQELQRLQERQEELAESARAALEALEERARQMQSADPAQAAAMQQAAQRGRQQQMSQRMEEAGESLEQNQTSTATAQQQEAIDSLEGMLQDMNDAQRQRDQALRRMLAGLIQSLEKLVVDQSAEIEALAAAVGGRGFAGLDAAMIALNQNTLAVGETARSDRATISVADVVDRAARAQASAIAALRASPVDSDRAAMQENESLRLLREALAEARRLSEEAEDRDQQRRREELRRLYREALEEQVAIRGQTEPYVTRPIDRRDRMTLRGLGERQETLRQRLAEARRATQDIDEAAVFAFAHDRLDLATLNAGKRLRAGQADRAVQRNQDSAVRILASMLEALRDLERGDEFREESGGDGGGGGGGGSGQPQPLLPPIAELRLLRGMQQEAAELTRALDDATDPAAREELPMLADLQQALAERGVELVEKMQQDRPTPSPAPAPAPESGGER